MEKVLSGMYSISISENIKIYKFYFDTSIEDTEEYFGIKGNSRYEISIEHINLLFDIFTKNYTFTPEHIKELIETKRICLSEGRISKRNGELVVKFLKCFPNLKEIEFHNIKMTDFSWLNSMPNIESLRLFNCSVKNMKGIENLSNLKHIWFRGNNFSETKNLRLLSNLPNLIILQSYWNSYKSLHFIEDMTTLKSLQLVGCCNLSFHTLTNLNRLTNLKLLNLSDGGEIKADISKLYNLEYLILGNPSIKYSPEDRPKFNLDIIKGLSNLKKVDILETDMKEPEKAKNYKHLLKNEIEWITHNSLIK